jgi:DNA-binding Lrp family transcriptional regulator
VNLHLESKKIITASEKILLQDLQKRSSMSLKSSVDPDHYSYRQYLRIIDKLVENNVILGWVPIFHPFSGSFKKSVWFFLRTNPREPQDLDNLQAFDHQMLYLDGITGPYSLSALIQFGSDHEFNESLAFFDSRFSKPNPIYQNLRYQWLEVIAFYKYGNFSFDSQGSSLTSYESDIRRLLMTEGLHTNRPPTLDDLARKLSISTSTLQKQMKQMEENQSILGFSVIISDTLKPQVKSIVQFHIHPSSYADIKLFLQDDPHVSLLCKIQRESFNLLAVVYANSIQDLNDWLKELYKNEGILDTLTTIVLKNEKIQHVHEHFPIL